MTGSLWRGSWATRLRIASGLVLFTYVLFHFLNVGLGLVSSELMHRAQDWRQVVTRSMAGSILLYSALLTHAALALVRLARRQTLRMPFWEAAQIVLGLTIPFFLIVHIVFTRVAHQQFGVDDEMSYIIGLIYGTSSAWQQTFLLLLVWTHGCIGLHFWLRGLARWRAWLPWLMALAALVPGFALVGFVNEGRRMAAVLADDDARAALYERLSWPDAETFGALLRLTDQVELLFWGLLGLAVLAQGLRKLLRRRRSVRIQYVDGPLVTSPKGPTLLEISRANGIPHTSLCGGRGRCTTCRVLIEAGGETLPPPGEAERRSLLAVGAPPGTRLACQVRPQDTATVFRVFSPDGRRTRAHASQGQERRMAILFLDIRGFTARTTGQLPYDVVFMLNRFFDAIVPAIVNAGGTVDKYIGDGLLAIFETHDDVTSARAALEAAAGIGVALERFNQSLVAEGASPIRIGLGVHLGDLVLGEIGAAGHAPRTIIGEAVNAASRLESETKTLGVELLVSSEVLASAGHEADGLDLVTLTLRGVRTPMRALAVPFSRDLPTVLGPLH